METIFKSSLPDMAVFITFIVAIITSVISFFKHLHNANLIEKRHYYVIFCIFAVSFLNTFLILHFIKKSQFANTILGSIIIAFGIYSIFRLFKIISKSNFPKNSLTEDDKINLLFTEFSYFIFFSRDIYLFLSTNFIDIIDINNNLIAHFTSLSYMTFKLVALLFFVSINLMLIFNNIYNLLLEKIHSILIQAKRIINTTKITIEITEDNKLALFFNETIINPKYLKFTNYISIYITIPILIFILYLFEFLKMMVMLIFNIFIIPMSIIKNWKKNEFYYSYKLLCLSIFISISSIYIHSLSHNHFNSNAIKIFEFFGITILISIIIQELKDLKNNIVKKIEKNM